ncbi:hypothetical protein BC936DRAFT_139712 [Jimgerdemannia flammicorona]|uniref:Uncharacterized protein n=2 Tax=Jimgerdemannia flammicorona TaxID=994334 RepID=A0A433Q6E3_9FUNG|nr:hypothetical protein BC936DRAFT_139712 [Jimgerdemannia flammicorona]RUS25354.1 hypothetical protein BC938DRAFT_472289 [Jimgerdemannia flammicorona]
MNLPHLLFNLFFFLPLSSSAERQTGTLRLFVVLLVVCTFLPALLYCGAMLGIAAAGVGTATFLERDIVVGISGWVFAMVVGEIAEEGRSGGERRIFQTLRVPAFIYPIILLLFLEWVIPGSSFLGHLFALLSGYLYTYGYLNKFLPTQELYQRLESVPALAALTTAGGFVSVHQGGMYLPLFNAPPEEEEEALGDTRRTGIHTTSTLPTSQMPPPMMATVPTTLPVAPQPFPGVGQRLGD